MKLVITDLDGTLLSSNSELPSDFYEVYESLKEKGIKFAVASGRQYASIRKLFEPIVDEIYYIPENGALVIHEDEIILQRTLTEEDIIRVINATDDISELRSFCAKDYTILESKNKERSNLIDYCVPAINYIDNPRHIQEPLLKISFFNENGLRPELLNYLHQLPLDGTPMSAAHEWIDVAPSGSNKGVGVEALLDYLNIDKEDVVVFGDQHNDLEMLELLPNSYAVKNAQPLTKEKASFTLPLTNDEYAVTTFLKEYLKDL